ncbi:MAG: GDSL family lipase [Armatimonadetes bacterium]|nr:GDSL family lipase [Armatimonadota bacterium]
MTDAPVSIDGVPLPPAWEEQDPLLPYPGYFPESPDEWLIHRHRANKAQAQEQGSVIRAVFLGDSITEGWDKTLWDVHFALHGAVNFAIGGDKTCQILWRVADGLLDGLTPDVIVLAIGVNNIWSMRYSGEHIARGVAACLETIQTACPGAKVLLSAVLPCKESPEHPYRAVISEINAHVEPLANGDTVRFVNAGSALLEADGTLPLTIAPDGVHLSPAGYDRIAPVIAEAFLRVRR